MLNRFPSLLHQSPKRTTARQSLRTMSHIYASSTAPQPPTSSDPIPNDSQDTGPKKVQLTTHNQYKTPRLLPGSLNPNPLLQFNQWFASALSPSDDQPPVREPEAMAISSVSSTGIPSTRVVLLKTLDETGFVFFTNYNSRKSKELEGGYASLAIYWKEVSRQIRAVGRVEKVSLEESEEYFNSRPVGSRIGAWASEQSSVVGEDELPARVEEVKKRFGEDVPCPPHWGGWRIVPFEVEFWSGQPSRLHDRFRYTRPQDCKSTEWTIDRLAP